MSDRVARVALSRLTEPGDTRLAGLVAELGAEKVHDLLRDERDVAGRLRGLDPERDLRRAAEQGIRFVCPGDEEWPTQLRDLERAEPVLKLDVAEPVHEIAYPWLEAHPWRVPANAPRAEDAAG